MFLQLSIPNKSRYTGQASTNNDAPRSVTGAMRAGPLGSGMSRGVRLAALGSRDRAADTRILNGPDIRRLMKDQAFKNALKVDAYGSVKAVIENVLASYRA
ncbi:unnamed protein product [Brassicogethes aeneus]|uniref:Uncharacterized protein n=1 Tax=Brassicogethes aeneus TaxID=1431903 RepID=A0A9P0FFL7_BRAAE|nr:unnamed protein product [Brassicogethes aeneus]